MATDGRTWFRSSLCNPGKNCVEVGRAGSGVIIRDSKSWATLHTLDDVQWTAFLAHCRAIRSPARTPHWTRRA